MLGRNILTGVNRRELVHEGKSEHSCLRLRGGGKIVPQRKLKRRPFRLIYLQEMGEGGLGFSRTDSRGLGPRGILRMKQHFRAGVKKGKKSGSVFRSRTQALSKNLWGGLLGEEGTAEDFVKNPSTIKGEKEEEGEMGMGRGIGIILWRGKCSRRSKTDKGQTDGKNERGKKREIYRILLLGAIKKNTSRGQCVKGKGKHEIVLW